MSEVRLSIVEQNYAIQGDIHGSIADAIVAALSAEPETIPELAAALERYQKSREEDSWFEAFRQSAPNQLDLSPRDAGIVIVDLAARIVVMESTYSAPPKQGEVRYHDGSKGTEVPIYYRVPDDWLFLSSVAEYEGVRQGKLTERLAHPPIDIRAVIYGRTLSEFIVVECFEAYHKLPQLSVATVSDRSSLNLAEPSFAKTIAAIHARWLTDPREDLGGMSPREVMLAKREFIDFDLHTRMLQWSFLGEGPPGLSPDSYAYRYAGCGTHECVVYYDLVRYLLVQCWHRIIQSTVIDIPSEIAWIEKTKAHWLELPQLELDGRVPALIIENERRRLPIAVSSHEVLDEDCPLCQMIAAEGELGFGPTFWHLDGCNMDGDFAFSLCRTREEWEAQKREWESIGMGTEVVQENWQNKPDPSNLETTGEPELQTVEESAIQ